MIFSDKVKTDLLELIGTDKRVVGNVFSDGKDRYVVRYNRMDVVPELKDGKYISMSIRYYYDEYLIASYTCNELLGIDDKLTITDNEGLHTIKINPS